MRDGSGRTLHRRLLDMSGEGTAPGAITVEHVVLARRFIPRLRALAQALKRAGGAKLAIAEMERLIAEWNL
jgi:hypothetical protein